MTARFQAEAVLARLARVTAAHVAVTSPGATGEGEGAVEASRDGGVVVLAEAGAWAAGGRAMRYRARSRWRAEGGALHVEHVRQGTSATAVLDRGPDGVWTGREAHVCGQDRYACVVRADAAAVEVAWTISGPCKAARVATRYAA